MSVPHQVAVSAILLLILGASASPRALADAYLVHGLPVGRWEVEFANKVVETCEIRSDGTASVAEPKRNAGGRVEIEKGAFVITFDDDRVERWTPVGQRMVVEHWYPADGFPCAAPVLGIADRLAAAPSDDGGQAFFKAIADGRLNDVAEAIKSEPQRVSAEYEYGGKPLYWAAFHGQEKIAALLLDHGAEVDARGYESATPLYQAAYYGHAGTVKLLLAHQADIEAANERGTTPLYAAVSRGHEEVVKILLEDGANPNGPPSQRAHSLDLAPGAASPLLLAVLSATRRIADMEWSPEAKQRQQERRQEARRIAQNLIVHPQAEIDQLYMGMRAPLHMTVAARDVELTRLLLEHGADPNVRNRAPPTRRPRPDGFTPLHLAAGHTELTELLKRHGADPKVKNSLGQTPADLLQQKKFRATP